MAMTGQLLADFNNFETATKRAVVGMERMEGAGAKVDSRIKGLSGTSTRGATATQNYTGQLRSFDGVLAGVGVNIGRQTRALEDMERASGQTVGQLGKIATAGLVVGVGMAAWQIGRAVSDFLGLDKAIGGATAKLLGWGDLAGQVAGAHQDAMNLAFERTGIVAKDAGHALELNTEWMKTHTAAAKDAAAVVTALAADEAAALKVSEAAHAAAVIEAQKYAGAIDELTAAGLTWQETLNAHNGETINAIRYYLDAGVSQAALATAYGLTALEIRNVVGALGEEKTAIEAAGEAEATRAAAMVERANAKLAADAATPAPTYAGQIKYGAQPSALGALGSHARPTESFVVSSSGAGATVAGPRPPGGGGTQVNNIYVNGTAADVARQIEQKLIELAKLKGLLGGGTA